MLEGTLAVANMNI